MQEIADIGPGLDFIYHDEQVAIITDLESLASGCNRNRSYKQNHLETLQHQRHILPVEQYKLSVSVPFNSN